MEVLGATRAEAGCLDFTVHRDQTNPDLLVALERWGSREALDEHVAQPYVRQLGRATRDLLDGRVQLYLLTQIEEGLAS